MQTIAIQENDAGQRLDKFMLKTYKNLPKSVLYKSIRKKRIKLNKKRCMLDTILQVGDVLELYINDDLLERTVSLEFLKASPTLSILYEDDQIILVDKPVGVSIHGGNSSTSVDNLANRLKHYLYKQGAFAPESEQSFSPAFCNRLDQNTGGIVIGAKTAESLREMNRAIKEHLVEKKYLCLVEGTTPKQEDMLTSYHTKDSAQNKAILHREKQEGSKEIRTSYKVLEQTKGLSLLEVELHTGKSHQIRAQMAQIGTPLVGDTKYGASMKFRGDARQYQCLYAYKVTFCLDSSYGIFKNISGKTFEAKDIWFLEKMKK